MCSARVANVMNVIDAIFLKQKKLRKNFGYDILSKEV